MSHLHSDIETQKSKNMENEMLEQWLRILPNLYFHSTEETKLLLLNGQTDITGAEHLKCILSFDIKELEEIYSSKISSLTMLKKLGIVTE